MNRRLAGILGLLVAAAGASRAAQAQASDCTYDRCALRMQSTAFSERIVRGTDALPVATLGLFAPRIDVLATGRDPVRIHYASFRTNYNRGAALALVGSVVTLASLLIWTTSDYPFGESEGAILGLIVGTAVSIGGGISIRSGRDHLHQAMWHYNRPLAAAP